MPSENFTGIVTQSPSLFDQGSTLSTTLLQLQTITSNPLVSELPTATGMILPDLSAYDRLSHFPEDYYDLRPTSHLVRFMKALLGEDGVGSLRKRYLLAQLEQTLNSTHFYDLDRFYGALFGARRGVFGTLPMDPMVDVATPDGWDEIARFDSVFRERIVKLAKAITLGGTPMGMQALAEALTGVECDIYEVWSILESHQGVGAGRTYAGVHSTFANYGAMSSVSWGQAAGVIELGNLGLNARNEFVVRPKKVYNTSDPVDARQRAEDLYGVQRVINVLKPAHTMATIDDRGLAVHQIVPIASVAADSEFWEVCAYVTPREDLKDIYDLFYSCYDKPGSPARIEKVTPVPPFSASQGQQWSYATDVTSVESFISNLDNFDTVGLQNYDTVTFYDGKTLVYRPEYAVIDPQQALLCQTTGEGSIISAPYSGARKVVATHA